MNRIREARNLRNISQKELANKLNITQQAISFYEKGVRKADLETLEKIANILSVPVEYLLEETSDPEGWDLWEKNTGYKKKSIIKEIERMKKAKHITGETTDLQNVIKQAVVNLNGQGNTDRGILEDISESIEKLQFKLKQSYEDPKKEQKTKNSDYFNMSSGAIKESELIYDDLSAEAYIRSMEILKSAKNNLKDICNDLKLN